MIQTFRHRGLRRFHGSGSSAGIQPRDAERLRMQLAALETAHLVEDMDIPGFGLQRVKGEGRGRWSIAVEADWLLTFGFLNGHAYAVDYEDHE